MRLHPGLIVRVNNEVVAAVSSENLNILSARIHGDVISPGIATLDVTGGYYGDPEETKHLIWVNDYELSELDEVEVQFHEITENSHAGKTIDEIFPEAIAPADDHPLDIKEIAGFLREQPRLRNGFDLYVRITDADPQVFSIKDPDHSFFVGVMWNWKSIDSAKLSVSSATIQSITEQKSAEGYLRQRFGSGQSVRVRIVSK